MRSPRTLLLLVIGFIVASLPTAGAEAPGLSAQVRIADDFNADGFADLVVGIPLEDVGAAENAGAVAVLYGSPTGPQAESPADQFLVQGDPGIGEMAEPDDFFGWALADGDFNGDGFGDLAIGTPLENVRREDGSGVVTNAGAVQVLYGSASGLQTDPAAVQLWTQESTGIIGLAETNDQFGNALAAGDFDGDGFDDLAVGVHGEDAGAETIPRAGAINVIYGSEAGLQPAGDQHLDQDDPDFEDAAEPFDAFGKSVTAGDFDGDGFDDVAVGVPGEDVDELPDSGAAHVLYGGPDGLQAVSPDDQLWTQGAPDVLEQAEAGDKLGTTVGAADFNADGYADLAAGAPGEDLDAANAGAVSVIYGSANGLQATAPDDQVWTEDSPDVEGEGARGDGFGWALAAGDFDGDGTADLAVGVPSDDIEGTTADAGMIHVLYGSQAGLQTADPDDQVWTQGGDVLDAAEIGDRFGFALAAGDYNGDGLADLSIGVPRENTAAVDGGAVAVLLAAEGGLQAQDPDDQLWDQDSPDVEDHSEPGDNFGYAL
jgi:hypothetical protein